MSNRGKGNKTQGNANVGTQDNAKDQTVEGTEQQQETQQEQGNDTPENTGEAGTVIKQEDPAKEQEMTKELENTVAEKLALHEDLELKAFTQHLDEYAKRYVLKPAQPKDDELAHMKLHAAVRSLVRSEPKLQRAMFGAMTQRISNAKNGEYQLPTIVKHLTNPKMVQDKGERVFLGEFLTLMSKFGRLENKASIHREANVSRVFESISDKDMAKRLLDLFPKK